MTGFFRFRVTARRDRLFARWAATRLRLSDMDAEAPGQDGASHPRPARSRSKASTVHCGSGGGAWRGLPEGELSAALEGCAQAERASSCWMRRSVLRPRLSRRSICPYYSPRD